MANLPVLAEAIIPADIGDRLLGQHQGLRCPDGGRDRRFAIRQAVKVVEDMGFGGNPVPQGKLDGGQDVLFVVVQDKRQDLDHLPIAARGTPQVLLQASEGIRQFQERRSVA
jgi:hypothetical protein